MYFDHIIFYIATDDSIDNFLLSCGKDFFFLQFTKIFLTLYFNLWYSLQIYVELCINISKYFLFWIVQALIEYIK